MCKSKKSLYGLKQAPQALFDRLSQYLVPYGFVSCTYDPSLFILNADNQVLTDLISTLGNEFAIKNIESLHFFLGIDVQDTPQGIHITH